MKMKQCALLLLLLGSAAAAASPAKKQQQPYRIMSSEVQQAATSRRLQPEEEDEISFDGSLNDLFDQAYDKYNAHSTPPATAAPVSAAPVTSAPVTAAPVSTAPVSNAPITSAPVTTAAPVVATDAPITPAPLAPLPTVSQSPSSIPTSTTDVSTFIDCDDSTFESVDAITYRFAMEYKSQYDVMDVIATLERDMNKHLASTLMVCSSTTNSDEDTVRTRGLQAASAEDIGLVAIDSRPPDEVATSAFCGAVFDTNTCKVVDGQLRIFIAPKFDPAIASYKVRIAVRNYLNSIHQLDGLYATTYVAPDIINPADDTNNNANANGADRGPDTPLFTASSDNEQLSSRSIILFAFAGVAFIGSVGVAVWFRKNHRGGETPENTEIKDDPPPGIPHINTTDTGSFDNDEGSLSPFSKMLPAAYRLDTGGGDDGDMSIILELNENASVKDSSSIMISEGYSTDSEDAHNTLLDDDTINMSKYSYTQAPTLGAVKRDKEEQLNNNLLVDV